MKVMHLTFVKFAACMVLVVGPSARALAWCGDSLSAMAAGAAAVASQSRPMQQDSQSSGDDDDHPSIVGLWHIRFTIHDQTIQEAYPLWNAGGTEVHNRMSIRERNLCLGVWKRAAPRGTYKLAHRLSNYDAGGNFLGTINLSETLTLGHGGNKHIGSFTLDFYGPSGSFLMEVAGSVTGERISVE
jgi:hypothetical protein